MQKADPTYGIGINPISRLIQIQQAKKEKEPIYELVGEKGEPWKREYTMQVKFLQNTMTMKFMTMIVWCLILYFDGIIIIIIIIIIILSSVTHSMNNSYDILDLV